MTAFLRHLCPMLSRTHYVQFMPLLMSFPMGKFLARYVPNVTVFGLELNPGPFTVKEHVIITIMANVASNYAYAVSAGFYVQPFEYSHASTTYRPTLLPSKRSSTTRLPALHVSYRRSEI